MLTKLVAIIGRNALSFLAILVVLVVGSVVIGFGKDVLWSNEPSLETRQQTLNQIRSRIPEIEQRVFSEANSRIQSARLESTEAIEQRISDRTTYRNTLDAQIGEQSPSILIMSADSQGLEQLFRLRAERQAVQYEIDTLKNFKSFAQEQAKLDNLRSITEAQNALIKEIDADFTNKRNNYNDQLKKLRNYELNHESEKDYFQEFNRCLTEEYCKIIDSFVVSKNNYVASRDRRNEARKILEQKQKAEQDFKKTMNELASLQDSLLSRENIKTSTAELDTLLQQEASSWEEKFRRTLPTALGLWLGVVLLPIVLKVLGYFVFAPMAQKLRPVEVLAGERGQLLVGDRQPQTVSDGDVSKVSVPVLISLDEELLIHPDYLQSTGNAGEKETKWLLNWQYPLTSLAAGLAMLTRIRPAPGEAVVVSSRKDPFSEVGLITIPEGSAAVLQPRCLAGVVQKRDNPLRITSHWRLGTLHAWLTWQMRFLVFHGPVTVIAKGTRGVRIEPAGSGRSINQSATIGFSAGVGYAVRRCETFISYLRGEQDLFNDTLSGGRGYYIYEEMPGPEHKKSLAGRGVEGLVDAGLKVFGV